MSTGPGSPRRRQPYPYAVADVFDPLDHWGDVPSGQRYLTGDRLTLADVRLFSTLIRFDEAYYTAFKCNKKFVYQYDRLWPYLRDLYQMPGVSETVVMDHITDQGTIRARSRPSDPTGTTRHRTIGTTSSGNRHPCRRPRSCRGPRITILRERSPASNRDTTGPSPHRSAHRPPR